MKTNLNQKNHPMKTNLNPQNHPIKTNLIPKTDIKQSFSPTIYKVRQKSLIEQVSCMVLFTVFRIFSELIL